jgi:tRNA dimethylallyltransferase
VSAPLVVAIYGATGTGKTRLAAELADRLPCRLISCDALQVYRDFRVATEKPRGAEARHPWALVDWAEPECDVNLGDWVRAAEAEIRAAHAAGEVPVVVGGTGLYLRGLLKGVVDAPHRDPALRRRLAALAERHGVPYLHRVLSRLDPAPAARLAPRARQRIVRALEVRLSAGASLASLQGDGFARPDRFAALRVGLALPRETLYARLDARAAGYLAAGLVEEVRWLLDTRRVPRSANAFRALGYREVLAFFDGPPDAGGEAALLERIQRNTRRYAKRQTTWFRGEEGTTWYDPRDPGLADRLAERVRQAGG